MANKIQPVGLRPQGRIRSVAEYVVSAVVYPGDLVIMGADGKIARHAANTVPAIGVALSYAAADGDKVLVCDDPDQKYVIQADGSGIDAQTDIGLNYQITTTSASTSYRVSRTELDAATGATASNLPLRLLGVSKEVDNALGDDVDCVVKINNHRLGNAVEGL